MKAICRTYPSVTSARMHFSHAGQLVACTTGMLSGFVRTLQECAPRLNRGQSGISTPEYAITLGLLMCLCMPVAAQLGSSSSASFNSISDRPVLRIAIQQSANISEERGLGAIGGGTESSGISQPAECTDTIDDCNSMNLENGPHGSGNGAAQPAQGEVVRAGTNSSESEALPQFNLW